MFTILACSLASGIVFGFAALKPILIEEGVFHDLCGDEDSRENGHFCPEQDLKYVPRPWLTCIVLFTGNSNTPG